MKTRIKEIIEKTYQGKVTGHAITLENGVVGYLADKTSDKELKVNEEVDYTLEVKKNKQGKDYNLLTLKRAGAETQPNEVKTDVFPAVSLPSSISPALIFEMKVKMVIVAMQEVNKAFLADKITNTQIPELTATIFGGMCFNLDELNKK